MTCPVTSCFLVRMTKFGKGDRKTHLGWHKLHMLGWRLMLTAGMWHFTHNREAFHNPVTYVVHLPPLFHCRNIVPTESSLFFKKSKYNHKGSLDLLYPQEKNTKHSGIFSQYRILWTLQTQRTYSTYMPLLPANPELDTSTQNGQMMCPIGVQISYRSICFISLLT